MFFWLLLLAVRGNYLVVTQQVGGSEVSARRVTAFRSQMVTFGLPLEVVMGVKSLANRLEQLNRDYLKMLAVFRQSSFEEGILCGDDTEFHPNFVDELRLSRQAAWNSGGYTILSLCSGNLWGRVHGHAVPFGELNVNRAITRNKTDPTGRVYLEWPLYDQWEVEGNSLVWPGSPDCLLLKREVIDRLSEHLLGSMALPLDLNLRNFILKEPGMRCLASPQLCRENERGGKI